VRVLTKQIFDTVLKGAGTWYTSDALASELGESDAYAVHAVPTGLSSPAPTITISVEHSADGQNWSPATQLVSWSPSGSDLTRSVGQSNTPGSRRRFKITFSGTSPQCRLKLHFTGRSAAATRGPAPMP
jgi:hypothetical protein